MKIYDYSGRANISGDRIHQARTAQRLSQDTLAAKMQVYGVGLGREAISRIETGDRFVTDYELAIFARVLGVSLVWLTGDLEQKTERIIAELPTDCRRFRFSFPVAASPSHSPSVHFRDATKMIPAASVSRRKGGFFFCSKSPCFLPLSHF